MQDIGDRLGLSKATVSLALQNHPRISPATRTRVHRMAAQLQYRVSPLVAAHMTQLRMGRPASYRATVAVVQLGDRRSLRDQHGVCARYLRGISARCEQLGYRVFVINMAEADLTSSRLDRILVSRGIPGLVLVESPQPRAAPEVDWRHYASVAVGYAITAPDLHRACPDPYWITENLLGELAQRGYRRPGLALRNLVDQRASQRVQARFLAWQKTRPGGRVVAPLLDHELAPEALAAWIKRHQPDVVVSSDAWLPKKLRAVGLRVPEDIGFATTCWMPHHPESSGFDQNFELVGSAAADLLIGQLNRNERGLPEHPKLTLMRGIWHEGTTLRTRVSPPAPTPAPPASIGG